MDDYCPICGRKAETWSPNGRDATAVRCPRCGSFLLTGTALSMLPQNLSNDARSAARASHAIRLQTSEEKLFEIDSTMVRDITTHALPSPIVQLEHLIDFLKHRTGDAHFQPVDIRDLDALAGIVGAIDGDAVRKLLRWARTEGYVKLSEGGTAVTLTPRAWESAFKNNSGPPKMKDINDSQEPRKGHCPNCGPNRNADIKASFSQRTDFDDEESWTEEQYEILQCKGCNSIYIRHTKIFADSSDFETDPRTGNDIPVYFPQISYWPAPSRRPRPQWMKDLTDQDLQALLIEMYIALDCDLRVLAAIGSRTVLDRTMVLNGANEGSSFAEKLTELQKNGIISEQEQKVLSTLTDAGSAATHRGWKPSAEILGTIVDGIESFIFRSLVLKGSVHAIEKDVPAKQRRK